LLEYIYTYTYTYIHIYIDEKTKWKRDDNSIKTMRNPIWVFSKYNNVTVLMMFLFWWWWCL
jgi:hypothetical protein